MRKRAYRAAKMRNFLADFVPIEQFAKDVGKCTRTILRWMEEADGLPYPRLGNQRLIDPLDLDTGLPARIAADAAALAPLYAKRRATAAGERRHRRGNAARSPGTRARAWRRRRRDRGGA